MIRRLFNLLTVLSLLLCVAVVGFWVRSYGTRDYVWVRSYLVTSTEGKLYTCLFAGAGHDLRGPLRGGASDEALRAQVASVWTRRADRYSELRTRQTRRTQRVKPKVEMSRIGG